jgi:hypothetical protein
LPKDLGEQAGGDSRVEVIHKLNIALISNSRERSQAGFLSEELPLPARLAQQEDEKGMMEAACPQAVSASMANPDGVRAPRLHSPHFISRIFRECGVCCLKSLFPVDPLRFYRKHWDVNP